jgi:energy-coupling factor transporter ATP-binding protein EcfA2
MPADAHDCIRIQGARENNLRDLTLDIPKRKLTVFTGVSGSGKSSLVIDTIAAESQRLINETYTAFLQGMMGSPSRPDADRLEGLTTTITVDQSRLGSNPRSTVGTVTDVDAMLRVLFSRLAEPHIGGPKAFAFNVASVSGAGAVTIETGDRKGMKQRKEFHVTGGMCPRCEGRGAVSDIDLTRLYDDSKSLNDGALTIPGYKAGSWNVRLYSESGLVDADKPIRDYSKRELDNLLYKEPTKIKAHGINITYEGLVPRIRKSMLSKDPEGMQPHIREFVESAVAFATCPQCEGTRLSRGRPPRHHRRPVDRRPVRDAGQRPRRVAARSGRPLAGPSADLAARDPGLLLRDRAGIPVPQSLLGQPVGRRGPAGQDDPAPRIGPHRRHLCLRRAHRRPPPRRHRPAQRPTAEAARQVEHRPGGRAQARDHRHRRPRRRSRPGCRTRRRARSATRAMSTACAPPEPSPGVTWPPRSPSRTRCAGPPASLRSGTRTCTTCATSRSTSRSVCCAR